MENETKFSKGDKVYFQCAGVPSVGTIMEYGDKVCKISSNGCVLHVHTHTLSIAKDSEQSKESKSNDGTQEGQKIQKKPNTSKFKKTEKTSK